MEGQALPRTTATHAASAQDVRVLVDTSSWLFEGVGSTLEKFFLPAIRAGGKPLVVPRQVMDEVEKHRKAPARTLAKKAQTAAALMEDLRQKGLLEVFGGSEQTFADNVIQMVITRFAERYHFILITQDRDLARDAIRIGRRPSVSRCKTVEAFRVQKGGALDHWLLGPDDLLRPRKVPPPANGPSKPSSPSGPPIAKFQMFSGNPIIDLRPVPSGKPPQEGDVLLDDAGKKVILQKRLGAGGEGTVFSVAGNLVCKVYSPERRTAGLEAKLKRMLEVPCSVPSICWPQALVREKSGAFAGYLMPKASGHELQRVVFVKPLLESRFPNWTRKNLVTLALTILRAIKQLHDRNVLLGDINPLNFLVENERKVFLVDCDSYQVERFACPVGTATFLAPELLGKDLAQVLRTPEQEQFALATLVFMILMPGKPPYSHAGGGDPAENVRLRHFPYCVGEKSGQGVPEGPWKFMWSHLPRKFKDKFFGVFSEGERLSAAEWIGLLEFYEDLLKKGHVSDEIFPQSLKRLTREQVERIGGTWVQCDVCREYFGRFRDHQGETCPDCSSRTVKTSCTLCGQSLEVRAKIAQNPFSCLCSECRSKSVDRTCVDCGKHFSIDARDQVQFKLKKFTLPKRCKTCRKGRKGAVSGEQPAVSPVSADLARGTRKASSANPRPSGPQASQKPAASNSLSQLLKHLLGWK